MESKDTDWQQLCYLLQQDFVISRNISGLGTYRPTVVVKSHGWVGAYSLWLGNSLPFEIRERDMMKGSFYVSPVSYFILLNISYCLFSMMRCWAA